MNTRYEQRLTRPAADAVELEWRGLRAKLRLPMHLSERQRRALLSTMMEPGGLPEACERLNVTLGMVLGERLRNPAFRRLWQKAQQQRREILQTLLMDMAVRGLLPGSSPPHSEAREKFLATLAQSLSAPEIPKPPAPKRGAKPEAPRPAPAKPTVSDEADELARLIAEVERKVSAAEAELGLQRPDGELN